MTKAGKKIFRNAGLWLLMALICQGLFPWPAGAGTDLNSRIYQVQQSGVPADVVNRLLAACYARRLPAEDIGRFLGDLQTAAGEGLPTVPLVDKVQEGLSKNVSPGAIGKALNRMVDQYRMMRRLAGSSSIGGYLTSDIMVRLSQSLYIGLTEKELARLIRQAANANWHDVAAAAEFRAALKQYRFDQDLAEQIAVTGLKKGYFHNHGWDLLDMIAQARRHNLRDREIAAIVLDFVNGRKTYEQTRQSLAGQGYAAGQTTGSQSGKGTGSGQGSSGSGNGSGSGDNGGSGNGGDNGGNGGNGNGGGKGGGR